MYADVTSILRHKNTCISEALARAYISYMYMYVELFSVGSFGGLAPPPPPCQKAGYATACTVIVKQL